ncbi:MAG: hypothetical protein RIM99_08465 [Cyclobacteriaceae bacterium]
MKRDNIVAYVFWTLFLLIVMLMFQSCDDEVNPCLDPLITVEKNENSVTVTADLSEVKLVALNWYIDDELVETTEIGDNRSDLLNAYFAKAGTYRICLVIESETCDEPQELCSEVIIEEDDEEDDEEQKDCPDMFFESNKVSDSEYEFTADFEGIEDLEWYAWMINGETIENEGTLNDGDNRLNHTFTESGTYQVCIGTETPECPWGTEYCSTIEVDL